jgi:hypothetical protein
LTLFCASASGPALESAISTYVSRFCPKRAESRATTPG